ncbi:MAG TPA: OmpA family protein [Spongiibacteraceae bacterium]|nr:OmpA family protein [Spongiibacteraceae bacterium]
MLSLRRLPTCLLSVVLIIGGCAVERPRDVQKASPPANEPGSAAKPGSAGSVPGNINTLDKPAAPPAPATGPVPSAPTSGGIGYYQDRQEKVLNERLVGTGIRVQRNADTIKLIVPGKLAFAQNSEQLQANFTGVLDNVALVLKEYGKTVVDIKGYTDSTGSFEHNQQLSERRAQSLGSYLSARQIAATRIRAVGYGPRYPLAGNDTESGRAQNRRVEIELVPLP